MISIRIAGTCDAAAIATIYSYYVEETAISFEYEAPDEEEMARRIAGNGGFPFLVAEDDGMIVGYAYAHPFSSRAAYFRSVEVTIYLDKDRSGRGYGKALYEELEKRLKAMDITNLYAIVMYPENKESIAFHERMGYRIVGILNGCGEKFGRLWSVAYMEKII